MTNNIASVTNIKMAACKHVDKSSIIVAECMAFRIFKLRD